MSENKNWIIILGLAILGFSAIYFYSGFIAPFSPTSRPTDSGITVCYKTSAGESCETTKQLAIVNFEGKIYSKFIPFINVRSNIGSQSITVSYKIEVAGNGTTPKTVQFDLIQATTPFTKEITVNADDVEKAIDSLSLSKASLLFTYLVNVKETGQVLSGSSSIKGIQKLVVQAETGIGGGTASQDPTSQTSTNTPDFQKTTCTIPYYYYSSSGIPRLCSAIQSANVQADKTVRVAISISVANDPHTYGQSGGNIQLRVLDSQGNLMYAGQCYGNFCYIAGSKDNPQYAQSSSVLIGENRQYYSSATDTLVPRRIGGNAEIVIFDKGTYSILLIDDGSQVAKKRFVIP